MAAKITLSNDDLNRIATVLTKAGAAADAVKRAADTVNAALAHQRQTANRQARTYRTMLAAAMIDHPWRVLGLSALMRWLRR